MMIFFGYSGTVHPQLARTAAIERGALPPLVKEKTIRAFSWDSESWVSLLVPSCHSTLERDDAAENSVIASNVSVVFILGI